jgi:hypothetical protein
VGILTGTLSDWSKAVSAKLAISLLPCVSKKTFTQYRTTKRIKELKAQTTVRAVYPTFYATSQSSNSSVATR